MPVWCLIKLSWSRGDHSPWEIWVAFPRESQLWHSCATQPTVHAGCFCVSIIHRTLTWTTGCLTCAQMLMPVSAHRGVWPQVKESVLKIDSGTKIPCHTRESNLHQWRGGLMLHQWAISPHVPWAGAIMVRQQHHYQHHLLTIYMSTSFEGLP